MEEKFCWYSSNRLVTNRDYKEVVLGEDLLSAHGSNEYGKFDLWTFPNRDFIVANIKPDRYYKVWANDTYVHDGWGEPFCGYEVFGIEECEPGVYEKILELQEEIFKLNLFVTMKYLV